MFAQTTDRNTMRGERVSSVLIGSIRLFDQRVCKRYRGMD